MHRAQALLLCRLYVQDGITQSGIGNQLSVQGATVTYMLQRIEECGLVTRRRDPGRQPPCRCLSRRVSS
jgi:DNA-binding MarR family transcriptional regulator